MAQADIEDDYDEEDDSDVTSVNSDDEWKRHWNIESLEAFRPLSDRPPEPQIADAQRREFFDQIHRWLRSGYQVQLFLASEGDEERFDELWSEFELGKQTSSLRRTRGDILRGFLWDSKKLVVISSAEVFGRADHN